MKVDIMSKEENLECSFCGRKKAETDLLNCRNRCPYL